MSPTSMEWIERDLEKRVRRRVTSTWGAARRAAEPQQEVIEASMNRAWPLRDKARSQRRLVVSDLVVYGQMLWVNERRQNMAGSR
jgi:hypothetical protein